MTRSERNIAWIQKYIRVPEGKHVGQPLVLTETQKEWIREIYDTPTRTYILSIPRKNAKTATAAVLMLLHLVGPEAKRNSQLYSAAQSRDQAAVLFGLASKMVRMSNDLSSVITIRDTAKELVCPDLGTIYKALSSDAGTKMGLSPIFVVTDELGQQKGPRSELYEALETASAAHENPLSIIISTQAATDSDLLSILIDDALTGSDPMIKVRLHTADPELDPFDEETIRSANPHFDVFMNRDEVMRQAGNAKRMPSQEAAYRNLILNQRISVSNPFVSPEVWKANGGPVEEFEKDTKLYAGLDLSMRTDLTALVVIGKQNGKWHISPHVFTPSIGLEDRARRDRTAYDVWAKQGLLITTPGASVDYEFVAEYMARLFDGKNLVNIGFDRWHMDSLKKEFSRIGVEFPLEEVGQGYASFSPGLSALEAELLNERICHGMHPLLVMAAANSTVTMNPAGDRKLDKSKATGRIDPMVALAMAFKIADTQEVEAPKYQFLVF